MWAWPMRKGVMGEKLFRKQTTAALRPHFEVWQKQLHKAYMHTHDEQRVPPDLSGRRGFKNSSVLNGCIGYMDEMLTFL